MLIKGLFKIRSKERLAKSKELKQKGCVYSISAGSLQESLLCFLS